MKGFATDFSVCDSLYHFNYRNGKEQVVVADRVKIDEPGRMCFASVNFPSKGVDTKVIIDQPFVTEDANEALWQMVAYVKLKDGTVTENIIGIRKPLLPGQFMVLTGKVKDNGTFVPEDSSVGVSVTLDWQSGIHGHVEF